MSATVNRHIAHPADEPHTGSTEVVSPGVVTERRGGVVVVRPLGQLDRDGVRALHRAALTRPGGPVVVDLDDCILTDPDALAALASEPDDVDLCFVSRRLTCRLLLARSGVSSRFATFTQLEDALQARRFADEGYGPGWHHPPA